MQCMRDMLRGNLRRSLEALPPLDRLAAAWPVAAGAALASRGEVVAYAGGTAHIRVSGPEWMQPLLAARAVLQSDMARIAGVPVTAIHFELHPPPTPREDGKPRRRPHE